MVNSAALPATEEPVVRIETERFGPITVDSARMVTMAAPVIGFPGTTSYTQIDAGDQGPFLWLQSVQEPELAFVAVEPFGFFPDYNFEVSQQDQDDLELETGADARILVLVSIPSDPRRMTANLLAPVVINTRNARAKQVVLYDSPYKTRHYLLPQLE